MSAVPPIIDRDYLYKDKIWTRTGKVLKLELLPVDGEPPPKVTWYHKARNLAEDENVTITNVDYLTSIEIRNTVRYLKEFYFKIDFSSIIFQLFIKLCILLLCVLFHILRGH